MENEHQQLEVNQEKYGFSGYFSGKAGEFDPTWIHRRMSWASQMVIKLTSKSRIATKRRENYLKLNKAFSDLPNCSPLYPKLPEMVVPYFTLWWLKNRQSHLQSSRVKEFPYPALENTYGLDLSHLNFPRRPNFPARYYNSHAIRKSMKRNFFG